MVIRSCKLEEVTVAIIAHLASLLSNSVVRGKTKLWQLSEESWSCFLLLILTTVC